MHSCPCTRCHAYEQGHDLGEKHKGNNSVQLLPKPSLKGPVPSQILEKAFADVIDTLKLEMQQEGQAKADEAAQASRRLFMERLKKYGDGNWGRDTAIKQYRRRKWWWMQEQQRVYEDVENGLSI